MNLPLAYNKLELNIITKISHLPSLRSSVTSTGRPAGQRPTA